jgi:hypothetical protein
MNRARETLIGILEEEKNKIRASYPLKDVVFPVIEIIRAVDYYSFMLKLNLKVQNQQIFLDKYLFGWSLAFSSFYRSLEFNDNVPLFKFDVKEKEWVDSIIQHAASIQICQKYLDYEKADLVKLTYLDDRKFQFEFLVDAPGSEYYEVMSLSYYHSVIDKLLNKKSEPLIKRLPIIREELKSIVSVFQTDFISYQGSEETNAFYSQLGYLYLVKSQIIDEFEESDVFGGITYKEYIDFAEDNFGSALMHRDCCVALAEKTSHRIYLRNILSYCFSRASFLSVLKEFRKLDKEKASEILSCYTINKENYEYHLSFPGAKPAPFFQVGNDILVRSDYGSMTNPVFFLNRELRRKFPKDYFSAVNKREARFKKQLFNLFQQERIMKVSHCIEIRANGQSTDIDAVLFDKNRAILGLFQLKWQDMFSGSMRERFSRISNLIPKSIEWIDKVETWIASNDSKSILQKLKIGDEFGQINDIYLFVLSRNNVHFTNTKLDKRASWGSWFQLLEASAKIKDPFNTNPIGELAAKLNFFSPESRKEIENLSKHQDIDFEFAKYTISIKGKK